MSNEEQKENVINAVQWYPFLYDMSRSDDKDVQKRENAWQAIAFQCCSDGNVL